MKPLVWFHGGYLHAAFASAKQVWLYFSKGCNISWSRNSNGKTKMRMYGLKSEDIPKHAQLALKVKCQPPS